MSRRFKLPNASEVVAAPGSTPSGLTYSRVPFADLDGRLTDQDGFNYSNILSKLTVPALDATGNIIGDGDITSLGSVFAGDGAVTLASNGDFGANFGQFGIESGKVTNYGNVPTQGYGIPAIVDDVALTGQVANIASTNFTNAGVAGTYRLGYYLVCTTAAVGAGTIVFAATFNDGIAVRTLTGTGVLMTATNKASTFTNADINSSLIKLGSGSIAYSVQITGIYSTAAYSLFCSLERLS